MPDKDNNFGGSLGLDLENDDVTCNPRISCATKPWFPYRCICRISRTKKIHRTDITLWKPPVQMLNTKEMADTTFCTR